MVVVMLTDIPNESYVALASRTGLHPEAVERALRAIAPPIARAAQVKVLREKAEEINRRRNGTRIPDVAEAYRVAIATLLTTANELEGIMKHVQSGTVRKIEPTPHREAS
jgi:enoyl-CoA hydratase/carnithine racemase